MRSQFSQAINWTTTSSLKLRKAERLKARQTQVFNSLPTRADSRNEKLNVSCVARKSTQYRNALRKTQEPEINGTTKRWARNGLTERLPITRDLRIGTTNRLYQTVMSRQSANQVSEARSTKCSTANFHYMKSCRSTPVTIQANSRRD